MMLKLLLLVFILSVIEIWGKKQPRPCKFGDRIEYGHLGREVKLEGNLDAYLSHPNSSNSRGGVIVISDIWGWELSNTRAFADLLMDNNFTAIVPDAFLGKSSWNSSLGWGEFGSWVQQRSPNSIGPAVDASLNYLNSAFGIDKVAMLGFCWGGQAVHFTASERDDIVAAVSCYGLMPVDHVDFGKLKTPTLFIFGKDDNIFPPSRIRSLRLGLKKRAEEKYAIRIYDGMGHGFVSRKVADPGSKEAEQIHAARKRLLKWLKINLK